MEPDVATAQDYYAFGGLMPGNTFTFSNNYKYGFNGKENDNDVKGVGNQIDYGERIYDPRTGRFNSVDPIAWKYPELSSYQFASDQPTLAIDQDGLETAYDNYLDKKLTTIQGSAEAHENAVVIGKVTESFVEGAIRVLFSPFNYLSYNEYGNHLAHNSEAYKQLQVAGRNSAKDLAINVAFTYVGGELFGSADDIRTNGVSVNEAENTYRTQDPAAPENSTQLARTKQVVFAENQIIGKLSEDIVAKRLRSQLVEGQSILTKPRIYLRDADGNLTNQYAVPDFAIYNTNTGKIIDIVDAKNGGAGLTGKQEELFKYGGEFKRSGRAKDIIPQDINKGALKINRTNLTPGDIK